MTEAPKRSKTLWYVLGCLGLSAMIVPCILVAIAVPAYQRYMRRARGMEARANVAMIASGVRSYCDTERAGTDGFVTHELPAAAGPTPSAPGPERQFATFGPEWASVGFATSDPIYYSYSMTRPNATTLGVLAEGDLDGNGVRSRFESTCMLEPTGSCTCSELQVTNELE